MENLREYIDLSRLDDEQLCEIFRKKHDDQELLEALKMELNKRESDEALELLFEVVKARRAFARGDASMRAPLKPRSLSPVDDWLGAFLKARGMTRPDGRALYRYRMVDGEYAKAKEVLRFLASSGRLSEPNDPAAALFVSYCAEWFRRESDSTFLRWDNPAPDLFPEIPYFTKQDLAERGLRYWGRELRVIKSRRMFLLTLALEGGFPVRILASGARGWLRDYLRSIMRRAISWRVDTREEITPLAEEERGRMRKSYRHDDFVALCSELVESLIHLRRMAEDEAAGTVRNSALLDARYPGWRDELPIYVPAEDEALVTELLTGLLDERMTGLSTQGVEARRYLVRCDGQWFPALQLLADGEISSSKLPNLSARGRARAIPTGELGNHLTGELALLEPPVGEQRRWRIRPFTRTAKLLRNFPFAAPVATTLTSPDGVPCPWTWPRGEALRSDVLVFHEDEGSTPSEKLLRFLRSGSTSSPAKTLYVLFPDDWSVEAGSENAIAEIEELPAFRRKLARLVGKAYFRGGESEAVSFRVEPDTEGREQELDIAPAMAAGFELADDRWELVSVPVAPSILERGKQPRSPRPGELFFRRPGGKWAALSGPLVGTGLTEVSWRDPEAGVQIEKRLLALVPKGAGVSGKMKNAQSGEIHLERLPGWALSVGEATCLVDQTEPSSLSIRFTGRPKYRLPMTLRPPAGQPIEVILPLLGRDAAIALADGSIVAPGQQVDLSTLRGAFALSPQRTVLHLAAKGHKSGGLSAAVEGELPLGVLRSAIDETLATLPGQDDLVELDFIGDTRPPIRVSRYRLEQLTVEVDMVRWPARSDSAGPIPVARMILDPCHEHALEYDVGGLWRLPEPCKGLCLVYLRDGVDVVSRPVPVFRPGSPDVYSGRLVTALTISDFKTRQLEIVEALRHLGRGEGEAGDLNWLLDAVSNLNGLPASAFDALKLLPSVPEALIGLLLGAREAGERGAIWALQNELPFLWLGLSLTAWRTALQNDFVAVSNVLAPVFGAAKAASEALKRLMTLRDEVTALEPALVSIFKLADVPTGEGSVLPPLHELTSGYVAGQFHRGRETRNDLASDLVAVGLKLPSEILAMSHQEFAGLFAPVLLAASAQGRLSIDRNLAPLVRRTLREDPAYVSAAWSHLLMFYRSS